MVDSELYQFVAEVVDKMRGDVRGVSSLGHTSTQSPSAT